jgi:uncharacterized membrane protein YphA (DoxX/SURF4 family)
VKSKTVHGLTDFSVFIKSSNIKSSAYSIGYYLIAVVLLFSGISKILNPIPLIETLKLIAKVPEEMLIIVAAVLPIVEISLGVLLILKLKPKPVLLTTLVLFAAFFLFSVYGTIVGLKNDCGCFGSLVKSEIGWGMIYRNGMLLFIVSILYYEIKR